MKLRNLSHWPEDSSYNALLFFAQRMDELTFTYTLDSYKPKAVGISALASELIIEFNHIKKFNKNFARARHIFDELKTRLKGNKALENLVGREILESMNWEEEQPVRVLEKVKVFYSLIEPKSYFDALKAEVLKELGKDKPSKKEIDFYSSELASFLQSTGVSLQSLNDRVMDSFFSKTSIDKQKTPSSFIESMRPKIHEYEVWTPVKTQGARNSSKRFIDETYVEIKNDLDTAIKAKFNAKKNGEDTEYFVCSKIDAMDPYSASIHAQGIITKLHDIFSIYFHKVNLEFEQLRFVKQTCDCGDEIWPIGAPVNSMEVIEDNKPSRATKKVLGFLVKSNLYKGSDSAKFSRIVDFHGMSCKSDVVENQFLNLWTAFEAMIPKNSNQSQVDSVVSRTMPFIELQYTYKILHDLLHDLQLWNKGFLDNSLNKVDVDDKEVSLLALLTCDEFEHDLNEIYEKLDRFELLRFRMFQIGEKFKNPRGIKQSVVTHRQRVEWQLNRIYRARNMIVHQGTTPSVTGLLLENAHGYFDQVFNTICELSIKRPGLDRFEDIFEYVEILKNSYFKQLDGDDPIKVENVANFVWRAQLEN